MTWLAWRNARVPLALLLALALALGLGYGARVLPGTPPFASARELGPWVSGTRCEFWAGLLKDRPSSCLVSAVFAGRWLDWWAPLLATLVGALFGSRLNSGMAFLQLQPLSAPRVLVTRLGFGLLAVTVTVLLGAALVSTRGALSFTWWSGEQVMGQFWLGTLLVWLRGAAVLLCAASLARLLPSALAALISSVASLALLGFEFDPFVRRLSFEYTPVPDLLNRDNLPLGLVQAFVTAHAPDRLLLAPRPEGWAAILGVTALLLLVTGALYARWRAV
ncbi:hypothetical protein DAERI_090018 [Deinococcus aerius]|uniref:Uncharacterized protein n=1 Tax=Deinococcus aerius TaxID=200253 RepID=A0A2I9CWQ0_9DEIO|nr:hypothetical protein [Deinococcus aerius]GBF06432.1 hypothetical protein DAERI_090018 [Deinococcus aerius]